MQQNLIYHSLVSQNGDLPFFFYKYNCAFSVYVSMSAYWVGPYKKIGPTTRLVFGESVEGIKQ